jgi:hypothetical protein
MRTLRAFQASGVMGALEEHVRPREGGDAVARFVRRPTRVGGQLGHESQPRFLDLGGWNLASPPGSGLNDFIPAVQARSESGHSPRQDSRHDLVPPPPQVQSFCRLRTSGLFLLFSFFRNSLAPVLAPQRSLVFFVESPVRRVLITVR